MKAEELRLGNLIQNKIGLTEVTRHTLGMIELLNTPGHYVKFNPIPLTEEWLLKMGFYKGMYYSISISKEDELLEISFKHKHTCISLGDSISIKNVEHVHQLQNLYHALTGEELTIKE